MSGPRGQRTRLPLEGTFHGRPESGVEWQRETTPIFTLLFLVLLGCWMVPGCHSETQEGISGPLWYVASP